LVTPVLASKMPVIGVEKLRARTFTLWECRLKTVAVQQKSQL
jgi:hypothetical protein